ncbi:GTP-binding family protein [Artemisia annua]|uniref:GTP-binding family protein n=1 Tax=Artemisia annua TaxID=35608 RepID=A0A2U1MAL6_ARTAN|nr:GTP-binding family protein [Artemisia annua]
MVDYAQNSLLSNESELHRRQGPNYICYTQFNVGAKRTNVPRLNKFRARFWSPYGFLLQQATERYDYNIKAISIPNEGLIPIPNARLLQSEITVNQISLIQTIATAAEASMPGTSNAHGNIRGRWEAAVRQGPPANYASLGRCDQGSMKLGRLPNSVSSKVNIKRTARGLLPWPVRSGIVGYPNAGSSSLMVRSGIVGYPNAGSSSLMSWPPNKQAFDPIPRTKSGSELIAARDDGFSFTNPFEYAIVTGIMSAVSPSVQPIGHTADGSCIRL